MTQILTLEHIQNISKSWSKESSMNSEEWSQTNPSKDQCAVTAALVWEKFGIPVVRGQAFLPDGTVESHYWNENMDLTQHQFSNETTFQKREGVQGQEAYEYILSNPNTKNRLDALRRNFDALTPH